MRKDYDFSDPEKICPKCDTNLHPTKYEIKKEFKYIPSTLKIIHHKK